MLHTSHKLKMIKRTKTVTLVLDPELLDLLREVSRREERSVSQITRRLLRAALEGYAATPPRNKLHQPP